MPVVQEPLMHRTGYRDILPIPHFVEFGIPEHLRSWAYNETKYTYSVLKYRVGRLVGHQNVPQGHLLIAAWTATVQIYLLLYHQDEEERPFSEYCRVTYPEALRTWRAAQYLDALTELYNNNILQVVTFLNTCVQTDRFRRQFPPYAPCAHVQTPRLRRCLYTLASAADAEERENLRNLPPLLIERHEAAQQETPAALSEE